MREHTVVVVQYRNELCYRRVCWLSSLPEQTSIHCAQLFTVFFRITVSILTPYFVVGNLSGRFNRGFMRRSDRILYTHSLPRALALIVAVHHGFYCQRCFSLLSLFVAKSSVAVCWIRTVMFIYFAILRESLFVVPIVDVLCTRKRSANDGGSVVF